MKWYPIYGYTGSGIEDGARGRAAGGAYMHALSAINKSLMREAWSPVIAGRDGRKGREGAVRYERGRKGNEGRAKKKEEKRVRKEKGRRGI